MKNILLSALLLTASCFSVQAQSERIDIIEKKIDDCGCNSEGSPDPMSTYEKISITFGAKDKAGKKGNEVVNQLLESIGKASEKNRKDIKGWINVRLKDDKWTSLKQDSTVLRALQSLEDPKTDLEQAKLSIICILSKKIHAYYLENEADIERVLGQRNYYATIFEAAAETTTDTVATKPTATVTESSSADFSFAWILAICSLLANAGLAFMWYSEKKKHQNHSENTASSQIELNEKLKEKEAQIKKLEVQLAQSEQKVETIKRELETKEQTILFLEQQQAKAEEKALQETKNPQHLETHKISRYLFAPTADGVFYQNSVKDIKTSDTVYRIEMNSESDETAHLYLITDPGILQRAESMAQELLISACDLQGRGKINTTSLQMTEGTVRREGGGWRITKKITLKW